MSTTSTLRRILAGVGLLIVLAALVVSGCSNLSSPLGPETTQVQPRTISADAFVPLTLGPPRGKGVLTKPVSTTQRVSAALGGTVTLSGSLESRSTYSYSLSFPPGALNQDTDITIYLEDDATVAMDLGPHGAQFNSPVTFTVIVSGRDFILLKKAVDIYWYNPVTNEYEGLGALITRDGNEITAVATLQHFSRYAMGGD